ncbi:MAG: hypothetical protein AB8G99_27620 [Planctomycetaceae bacterium]
MNIRQLLISISAICVVSGSVFGQVFPGRKGFDAHGGYLSSTGKATGRLQLETIDGRHFLITPEGHGFLSIGVTHAGFPMKQQHERGHNSHIRMLTCQTTEFRCELPQRAAPAVVIAGEVLVARMKKEPDSDLG